MTATIAPPEPYSPPKEETAMSEMITISGCPTCGALAQHIEGDPPTWRAVELPSPRWYDDGRLPTEPGVYYMESCDPYGRLSPGLMWLEEGKACETASIPTKYFGPIPGAMRPWHMVPLTTEDAGS